MIIFDIKLYRNRRRIENLCRWK